MRLLWFAFGALDSFRRIQAEPCCGSEPCERRVAPMSLTSYLEVRPWARAIKNKVVAREMPPWHASAGSMKMANDRSLSQTEIETIVA
jgi:hypothetical protein